MNSFSTLRTVLKECTTEVNLPPEDQTARPPESQKEDQLLGQSRGRLFPTRLLSDGMTERG